MACPSEGRWAGVWGISLLVCGSLLCEFAGKCLVWAWLTTGQPGWQSGRRAGHKARRLGTDRKLSISGAFALLEFQRTLGKQFIQS